ncbi:MAG: lipid-A-disaccharide synthase [Saprospiraceae bacterium]|nr:lipid-A-disaccharide synthase [Saprospiraceae bacterium]MCB9318283.1 lipid-A-disaccharide synthase [Lewinellaceae bacterium]
MRYYVIAGEASGDLHGSNLIRAIHTLDKDATIYAWGGEKMEAAGAQLRKHYKDLAFMGFVEVVRHLGTIMRNLSFCREDLLAFKPDALILIDYPGFNMRIAKWAKSKQIPVYYYISPQIWAWKEKRGYALKASIRKMLCILPFEPAFYERFSMKADYVGHPLLDVIPEYKAEPLSLETELPVIAILPGSRKQEIERLLPVQLGVVRHFPGYQFVIAGVPHQDSLLYSDIIHNAGLRDDQVPVITGRTYDLLASASGAVVTSGTATLETALFGVPLVVVYKGSPVSYQIAKRLIRVKYISLVNLILDKPLVPELIQDECTPESIVQALRVLLNLNAEGQWAKEVVKLKAILGGPGASQRAGELICQDVPVRG